MSDYVALIKRTRYGDSGTELPPPIIHVNTYAYLSFDGEYASEFGDRIQGIVDDCRAKTDLLPVNQYSRNDTWASTIHMLANVPIRFD